jgi:hypothetical protein
MGKRARNFIDLTGQTFGKLFVKGYAYTNKYRKPVFECRCECGSTSWPTGPRLRRGATTSCGCYGNVAGREHLIARQIKNFKHGAIKTATYRSWAAAKDRCFCSTHHNFQSYGGRGVTMCDTWKSSFSTFLADMGERPEGTTLHRIDNDGNYEPGNCKGATAREQCENRRPVAKHVLSEEDLRSIRVCLREGVALKELATVYKVGDNAIRRIRNGVTWKHVA